MFRNLAVCILKYAHLQVYSRSLQLVATPVKYNHNSIEGVSILSNRITSTTIASKLYVGLSHMYDYLLYITYVTSTFVTK